MLLRPFTYTADHRKEKKKRGPRGLCPLSQYVGRPRTPQRNRIRQRLVGVALRSSISGLGRRLVCETGTEGATARGRVFRSTAKSEIMRTADVFGYLGRRRLNACSPSSAPRATGFPVLRQRGNW